jgi:hypothetical protein
MNCTSAYPPNYSDIHISFTKDMLARYPKAIIGFSDHSPGYEVVLASFVLGAKVIEKHVTLSHEFSGPDQSVSIDFSDLDKMIKQLTNLSLAINAKKEIHQTEVEIRNWAHRSLVYNLDLAQGSTLKSGDIWGKRPGTGVPSRFIDRYIGKTLIRNVLENTLLSDEDFQDIIPYDEYNEEDLIKKYKVVNLIIKYKTKLTNSNVFQLIRNSENSEKTAEILGTDNINKLSASNIVELLSHYKCNVEEMAKILGKDNINKINGLNLYNLVYTALSGIYLKGSGIHPKSLESLKNSNEILKALGPKNIAKLSDDNVKYFIDNAKNPEEMARILGKENIEKIHK